MEASKRSHFDFLKRKNSISFLYDREQCKAKLMSEADVSLGY